MFNDPGEAHRALLEPPAVHSQDLVLPEHLPAVAEDDHAYPGAVRPLVSHPGHALYLLTHLGVGEVIVDLQVPRHDAELRERHLELVTVPFDRKYLFPPQYI